MRECQPRQHLRLKNFDDTLWSSRAYGFLFVVLWLAFAPLGHADITTGLIGHWRLDDNSGTTAIDAAGNNGTFAGAAPPTWVAGHNGYALNFNGASSYVTLGTQVNALLSRANTFTISLWFNRQGTTGAVCTMLGSAVGANDRTYIQITDTGTLRVSTWDGASSSGVSDTAPAVGQWGHVVMVSNAGAITGYLNGGPMAGGPGISSTSTAGTVIGANSSKTSAFFLGYIDDVRIYDRALSASDVQELYNSQTLAAWWRLDETSGATAADSSGNHNNGTLTGATPPAPGAGIRGGAMVFDGVSSRINTAYAEPLGDFTVCGWFMDNGSTGNARIVDKSYTTGFWLGKGANNTWGGGILQSSFPYGTFVTLPAQGWHHLCMTRSGTIQTIVGDGGAAVNSAVVASTALSTTAVTIGHGGSAPFSGSIDDVRIWDRALSVAEINALYLGGVTRGAVLRNARTNL